MFVIITTSLCRHSVKRAKPNETTFSVVRRHLFIAVVLSTLFGLGWAFGLIGTSSLPREVYLPAQYIFSIFVGMQGVLIVAFHGIRSRDAREEWKRWWSTTTLKDRKYQFSRATSFTATVRKQSTDQTQQLSSTGQISSFHHSSVVDSDKPTLAMDLEKKTNDYVQTSLCTTSTGTEEENQNKVAKCWLSSLNPDFVLMLKHVVYHM